MACVWIWYCSAGDRVGIGAVSGTVCAMVLSATLATRGLFRDSTGAGAIGAGSATVATGAGASGSATTATTGAAGGALGARFAFGAGGGGGSGIGSTTCTTGSGVGSTTCAIGSMVSFGLFFEPGGRPLPLLAGSAPSGSVCSVGSIFFKCRKKAHLFKRRVTSNLGQRLVCRCQKLPNQTPSCHQAPHCRGLVARVQHRLPKGRLGRWVGAERWG
jgi:hypothetical protein